MLSGLAATTAALAACPASAPAAPVQRVLVLRDGQVHVRHEPGSVPRLPAPRGASAAVARGLAPRRATRTVQGALDRLRDAGRVDQTDVDARMKTWRAALAARRTLTGQRRAELTAVAANVAAFARTGRLTPGRLGPVFLTLDRNRQWWTEGPMVGYGTRVQFSGSSMLWEAYPGQGIELHPLANWSKMLAFVQRGPGGWRQWHSHVRPFLRELLPTAVHRGGGLAWEYYFDFDGGRPPWVSSISQGTALMALVRASQRLHRPDLLRTAHQALGIFRRRPPVGIATPTKRGDHYLIYSFAPRLHVLNAFIQSLNGLWDLGNRGDDALARRLFRKGDREARWETPQFIDGDWSFYSPGVRSSSSYHELLRDFLQGLCDRTQTRVYCRTAQKFTDDLG
jgi:D-glucuronyl C5-epimerase C-terminus